MLMGKQSAGSLFSARVSIFLGKLGPRVPILLVIWGPLIGTQVPILGGSHDAGVITYTIIAILYCVCLWLCTPTLHVSEQFDCCQTHPEG